MTRLPVLTRACRAAAVLAVTAVMASACSTPTGPVAFNQPPPAAPKVLWSSPPPVKRPSPPPMAPPGDYVRAVGIAVQDHLRVWIETELVTRWLAGPASFRTGIRRVAFLAGRPGVAGIKIADEMGYQDGLTSPAQMRRFLLATARALHAAVPHALILVDMVVPELGCQPGAELAGSPAATCAAQARAAYPQLALSQISSYLRLHAIDVLDLSAGLLEPSTYAAWGTTTDVAEAAAWRVVGRLGWGKLVHLQGRKALAHPGRYTGTLKQAEATVHTYVDIPLSSGAGAVDIWAWRQQYKDATYRLLNPGLQANTLWTALEQRRRDHDVLFTHMSPTSVESGLATDLAKIATVFTNIFIAAGTG